MDANRSKNVAAALASVLVKTPKKVLDCGTIDELAKALGCSQSEMHPAVRRTADRLKTTLALFGIACKADGSIKLSYKSKADAQKWGEQILPCLDYLTTRTIDRIAQQVATPCGGEFHSYLKGCIRDNTLADLIMDKVTPTTMKRTEAKKRLTTAPKEKVAVISALKLENQQLKKKLDKATSTAGSDELLVERITESIDTVLPDLKFIHEEWKGGTSFKGLKKATAVLHISDWHIGSQENVNGLNDFNYSIACERVRSLTNKYIDWTEMHRSMYNVDELVIIATGDMISGDIHEELLRTNEFSVPEQCVRASTLIAKMANELSKHFRKTRIEYVVADNHSRTTKKIQFGDGKNSYNYIVGTMAKLMLRDNKTVVFNLYPEIQSIVKVENLRYLITHGNCVRGGFAGIPFYSMQRKVGAEAAVRMNMPENAHFDKIVMGHYHTPLRSVSYEMTGCLSSTTAFDQAYGRHCRACQTGWVVVDGNELDYYELWLS